MKIKLLFILSILNVALYAQKEYTFGSTGQQKLLINPALAGNSNGLNIQTLYTSSPMAVNSNQVVYAGIDYNVNKFNIGLSHGYFDFNNGLYHSNQTDISLGYKINLNKKITLIPAVQVSYYERKVDRSKMDFNDDTYNYMSSPGCGDYIYSYSILQNKNYISYSSGLVLDINKTLTFGVSFYDINQPDQGSFGPQKRNLTQNYHVSGILFKDKQISLQPYSVLKLQGSSTVYFETGVYSTYKIISLHTAIRNQTFNWNHAIVGISINYKGFRFGYTLNNYLFTKYNNHELFLSTNLFTKNKSAQRNLMLN